jgi:hypothetical protein
MGTASKTLGSKVLMRLAQMIVVLWSDIGKASIG